jgi:hypothetical protein
MTSAVVALIITKLRVVDCFGAQRLGFGSLDQLQATKAHGTEDKLLLALELS